MTTTEGAAVDAAVENAATTIATTEAAGGHAAESGPFYTEAEFWVGVGFILLLAFLVYKKVPQLIFGALDAKSAKIRHDIDEAARLRSEAEQLLARATARLAQAENDSKEIVAKAVQAGEALASQAALDLAATIARRAKSAEDRIAVATRAAEAELRDQAVDLATRAARTIIATEAKAADQARLTIAAIAELDSRLN